MDLKKDFKNFVYFAYHIAETKGFLMSDAHRLYLEDSFRPEFEMKELGQYDYIIVDREVSTLDILILLTKLRAGGIVIIQTTSYTKNSLVSLGRILQQIFSIGVDRRVGNKYSAVYFTRKG